MKKRTEGLQLDKILDGEGFEEGFEQLEKDLESLYLDMISYFTANATEKKTF